MTRGPGKTKPDVSMVERAQAAWGIAPDWIQALAEACDATSQTVVAARIGYSASTISECIANKYRGDVGRVAEKVGGALLKTVVDCPILGEIGRDRCLDEQRQEFRATSAMRAQLYHACRSGCPFSKIPSKEIPDAA